MEVGAKCLRIHCGDKIVDFPLKSEPIRILAGLIGDDKVCAEDIKAQWGAFLTELCKEVTGHDLSDVVIFLHTVTEEDVEVAEHNKAPLRQHHGL